MKGCAITALVLLLLGVAMTVVAVAIKGTTSVGEVVESVTGGRVHFNLNPSDFDFGVNWGDEGYYDIDVDTMFDSAYNVVSGDVNKYSLGYGIKSLNIEVGGCVFYFLTSEDENFYVEAENMGKFQSFVEGETLYLKSTHHMKDVTDLSDEFKRHKITLYVPEGSVFEDVNIDLGAGQLIMKDISSDEMSLEVGAGQITADYLQAKQCNIEVGMGEIVVEDMMMGDLNAETGMGHLNMKGTVNKNLTAECSMGAIEMKLNGDENDFNYNLDAAMGSVSIGREDYSGLAHEKTVDNGANKMMDIDCAMGAIDITFQ